MRIACSGESIGSLHKVSAWCVGVCVYGVCVVYVRMCGVCVCEYVVCFDVCVVCARLLKFFLAIKKIPLVHMLLCVTHSNPSPPPSTHPHLHTENL